MKKLIVGAPLLVAGFVGLLAGPVLSQAPDAGTISEYCADHRDFGLTHGACVAYFQARNVVPHDASVCQDEGIWKFLGVANHGQCVKRLADLRK